MSEQKKLTVHVEFGDVKADFEGDPNKVTESIIRFLSQIYPNLEILRRIVFRPDLARLAERLSGLVEILTEGPIIVSGPDLLARNAVCLALLGAYLGNRLGILQKDTLSSKDLSKLTGKARKTISNELPKLSYDGFVERTIEGEYRLTTLGIRKTEEIVEVNKQKWKNDITNT